jgi:Flp pilus assembly protein TadG
MLAKIRTSVTRPRRGMVAALLALLLPVVVGVMALTLDGGLLYVQRRQAQSAADSAALAGAYQLYNGLNFSVAQSSAIAVAATSGFSVPSSSVTQPQAGYLSVSVTTSQPRFFSSLWGSSSTSIAAAAVARGTTAPYSKAAVLVLAATGTSVTATGSAQVNVNNGSVVVDSTSASAVLLSGSAGITTSELDLSGGVRSSSSVGIQATVTKTNQPSTADPLGGIAAPSSSGLAVQSSSQLNLSNATQTLNPGVYNGGISLSGSCSITLNPGVYYINGGGFKVSGTSGIVGSGVLIYNTGGGAISFTGTGTIALSPMASGTYAGITVFQDGSNTASATLSGGSNMTNSGTYYFPSAALSLSGGSGVGILGSQFIAKTVAFSGSSAINVTYSSSVAGTSSLALVQ